MGKEIFGDAGVAGVADFFLVAVWVNFWWWGVVTTAPGHKLLLAVLFENFCFVFALEGAVVALIKAPVFCDGKVALIDFLQGDPKGANSAFEN